MNKVKIIKMLSICASIIGTVGMAWVSNKENEQTLDELVKKHLKELK